MLLLLDTASEAKPACAASAPALLSAEPGVVVNGDAFPLTPKMAAGIRFGLLTHCTPFRAQCGLLVGHLALFYNHCLLFGHLALLYNHCLLVGHLALL